MPGTRKCAVLVKQSRLYEGNVLGPQYGWLSVSVPLISCLGGDLGTANKNNWKMLSRASQACDMVSFGAEEPCARTKVSDAKYGDSESKRESGHSEFT